MVNPPIRFSNKQRGSTLTSVDGVEFDFYPSIAFTAKKAFELEASIRSFRVPLEESIREVIRPSIRENFNVGGRPEWASLAESTIKKKGSTRVNVKSGRLSRVAQQRNIWDVGTHTAQILGGELIGRVKYALFVQAGHKNKQGLAKAKDELGRNIFVVTSTSTPARPYLMIQPEDAEKIKIIFGRWIDGRIAKAWGR